MGMNKKHDTRAPKQERSKETKQNIVAAGLKLFSKKGLHKTNSKEIAKEAGVSIGSFYAYFQDKESLFKEVLVDYQKKIRAVVEDVETQKYVQTGKRKGFLRCLINGLIEAHSIYPQFHQEMNVMTLSDPDISKLIENSRLESVELTKRMLFTWRDKLRVEDIEAAAVVVQTSTEETVHTVLFSKQNVPKERIIGELTDMLSRYLFKK